MQLDGSTVDLKDYLSKANWKAVQQAENPTRVMVNYRFDVLPRALPVAFPYAYDVLCLRKNRTTSVPTVLWTIRQIQGEWAVLVGTPLSRSINPTHKLSLFRKEAKK